MCLSSFDVSSYYDMCVLTTMCVCVCVFVFKDSAIMYRNLEQFDKALAMWNLNKALIAPE
jgi:hypothetical protein